MRDAMGVNAVATLTMGISIDAANPCRASNAADGVRMMDSPLTIPLKLNPCTNGIFQFLR
jgi:hypothetical protein